ncbi:Carotenoid 9,10(9',10')-cleavage dioxygenase 1 [Tetrabaena socialis]|uniref:carotenoid 9,10-dioxygenase n=1 Tax=Tetrabaena socialis TaxID=47790 RepID=A0A2J7ZP44_9CHLO|nr:Carotenoid 9,10(9',10')-cleavage dioxygenase 1 [Tetrabaena socialis]|eukprot:PNH02028.1 Carotenoid 9,10(9',10')-cleavage dioxygenase 1 [Tetrabaena socialis]
MDLTTKAGKDACVGRITYPQGVFGGEAVFVPRAATTADPRTAARASEDDGFLVVYVYDTAPGTSYMNVYDARTMASKPVASLAMPRRVPYGFHGTWVTEAQLKSQVAWI